MTQRSPEYWRSRTYDVFYYAWVFFWCMLHLQWPKYLAKANYGLPYGGSALASKFAIQEIIGAKKFPATVFVDAADSIESKRQQALAFAEKHGYPILLKPDKGFVGKGIFKLKSEADMPSEEALSVDYLLQAFVPLPLEFGLFYARKKGEVSVPSINQKHFPTVTGDGQSTLRELAEKNERYSSNWQVFLDEHDLSEVLPAGSIKTLSWLGSNTLGSKFTNDTALQTSDLIKALEKHFSNVPGYNFGRLDVRSASVEAFQAGEFVIIEANGVMSLPTNMLDPDLSLWQAMKIWHHHANTWVKIARENRYQDMKMMPFFTFLKQSRDLIVEVEQQHEQVIRG